MPSYITYYRVSTDKQGANGLGMEAQRHLTSPYSREVLAEYVEVESGRKSDRPELQKALAHAKATGSILLIAKLDRLARNVHFISGLMEAKIDFLCADNPHANKMTIQILAVFAEHEAERISERTKAALAAAKARGTKLGGYRGQIVNAEAGLLASKRCRSARATGFRAGLVPVIENIKATGAVSLRQIAMELQRRGYRAPRGGSWSAIQVGRMMSETRS
jgi:DNA invertase Pin-like site-specific DNA recombinase